MVATGTTEGNNTNQDAETVAEQLKTGEETDQEKSD